MRSDALVAVLLGGPGSGKGTQAEMLAQHLGIPAISTGALFRAECAADTELGRTVCGILHDGGLVNDALVNQAVENRLHRDDCRQGFMLDGYPRSVEQAKFLDKLLATAGFPKPEVLHLVLPVATLVERLTARRECPCCGHPYSVLRDACARAGHCCKDGAELLTRDDDAPEVVTKRLEEYAKYEAPLVEYYRTQQYHRIEADASPTEVLERLEEVFGHRLVAVR